ncbi:TonB-dependent receptor [Sphingomonas sp. LM7]|uniref:TonB-dependent receptor n=1 Tax=Sphingomonas sp. LM7 TaxID=1938607 RepID=UPI001C0B217E|nr:TonB-dependent receptor [Sphingomonas sp. LM7]
MKVGLTHSMWRNGASVAVVAIALVMAGGASAQTSGAGIPAADPAAAQDETADPVQSGDDIVVTGFRGSLAKALDAKKEETGSVDMILAEDIGKFPDLNLSESIQRVPGVALARDGGEGRTISVRGLGPQFTRVRINGMEALTTAGGADASGGTNRGRGFDFNVFASDLFNSITVRKTAEASTEEGSLGATVDLQTAHPFDYKPGFTFAASAQASYNDLAEKVSPRGAVMGSWRNADETFGVLASLAFTKRKTVEEGYSTVRWARGSAFAPGFESYLGTPCINVGAGGASGTVVTPAPAGCATVNAALHPRFPRYDYYINETERLGATAAVQWAPTPDTLITLDALYADFKATREEFYLEAPSFSVAGACTAASRLTNCGIADTDVTAATIANNILVAGTFNDVDLRVEDRFDELDTKFKQLTLNASQKFGNVEWTVLGGYSVSDHTNPVQNTITFDQFNVDNYQYDYTDGRAPTFNFGTANLTSPTSWVLSQLRLRAASAKNEYRTAQSALKWDVNDEFKLEVGAAWKRYDFETSELRRTNGTTSNQETTIPAAIAAIPLAGYSQTIAIMGQSFLAPNYHVAESLLSLRDPAAYGGAFRLGPEPALGNNSQIREKDLSAYFQADFKHDFDGVMVRGNVGVRYVETDQKSTGFGFVGGAVREVVSSQKYEDWLPSANLVIEPTDNFVIRAAAAQVMARPNLGNLTPGVSITVSGANRTVAVGNPQLEPFRAATYDLAFEWYFARGALLSVALFQKDISTFVQTLSSTGTFSSNPFGLPDTLAIAACGSLYPTTCNPASNNWTFNAPANTPGGRLRGFEINYQQPLRFLPGFLSNSGVLLNYTRVTSDINYLNGAGAVVVTAPLLNLSKQSANGTLYYEDKFLSARVSAAYRSDYLTTVPGTELGTTVQGTHKTFNLDASIQFTLMNNLKLSLEAVNLTDQYQDQYIEPGDLLSVYHHTGREFLVGLRFNY